MFNKLERGYIENGRYHSRAIQFQEPTFDSDWNAQRLREVTARDLKLNPIFNLLMLLPECLDRNRLAHFDKVIKSYCADWKRLKIQDGLLYRRWYDSGQDTKVWQLIQPTDYCQAIFNVAHKSMSRGHLGFHTTRA